MSKPAQDIYCKECRKYLGQIRNATIRKGTTYLCSGCQGSSQLFDTLFGKGKK